RGRVGFIIHLVRVRSERSLYPFLEERFLFELAQLTRDATSFCRTVDFFLHRRRRILPPKHHPLVSAMRVLETAPHFHFHFVHEHLAIANLLLDFARSAEKRAEFTHSPANKGGLVFALKTMPSSASAFQARPRPVAIGGRRLTQGLLIYQNDANIARIVCRSRFLFPCSCSFPRHPTNLRK